MQLKCDSAEHDFAKFIASAGILFYVCGIPALFLAWGEESGGVYTEMDRMGGEEGGGIVRDEEGGMQRMLNS